MYKSLILYFLFLFVGLTGVRSANNNVQQYVVEINFDSIANVIESMPVGKSRMDSTISQLYKYSSKKESEILLNILREDASNINDKHYLRQLYFHEIIASRRNDNLPRAKKFLNMIRPLCYSEEDYIIYFNSLSLIVHETILARHLEEAYDLIHKGRHLAQQIKSKTIDYIVTKSLIYLYNDTQKYEEMTELILECLNDSDLRPENKRELYGYLANAYTMKKEYNMVIKTLDESLKYIHDNKNNLNYSLIYQSANINKLGVYIQMDDLVNAKKTIDLIDNKTDTTAMSRVSKFNYMVNLAKYNCKIKKYDKALEALKRLSTSKLYRSPYLTKQFYTASVLYAKGDKKEAATLFVKTLEESLEYKTKLIQSQREVSQSNTKIQQMLYIKAQNEKRRMNIYIVFGLVTLIIVCFSLYKLYFLVRELKKTVGAIQKAAIIAQKNDMKKDTLLLDMTQDIEVPLKKVSKLTQLLTNGQVESENRKKEYTDQIKSSSKKLLSLITNILELSRLESGMMKYVLDRFDLITVCNDNIMRAQYNNPKINIEFNTSHEELYIKNDFAKFNRLIFSLLTASTSIDEEITIKLSLKRIGDNMFTISVKGSPLILSIVDKKEQEMQNEINSIFVGIFKGSYYLNDDKIVITMPIDNIPDNIIIETDNTIVQNQF